MNKANIIGYENGLPYMENEIGCRWQPEFSNGKFGLGSFSHCGAKIGGTSDCMLTEEVINEKYYCTEFEEVENTPEKGHLSLRGYNGKIRITVDVVMAAHVSAVTFDMKMDPELPVNHRLFAKIPFSTERMDFVKFPYEETIQKNNLKSVRIETNYSTVPLVFGREIANDTQKYIGVGYDLRDAFINGIIAFDSSDNATAFRIYNLDRCMIRTVDMQLSWKKDALRELDFDREIEKTTRHFRFYVCMGGTQFECLKSYMDVCGYDKNVDIKTGTHDCINDLFDMFKRMKGYKKGKGYHLMFRADTGEFDNCIVRAGYGKMIMPSYQMQLALEHYRWWEQNHEEEWSRERSFEMADFYCKQQLPSGWVVPYETDTELADKVHPEMSAASYFGGYYIITAEVAMGARYILLLHDEVLKREGIDKKEWEEAGLKAGYYLASLVTDEGVIGRNYNFNGEYDKTCIGTAQALISFEFLYQKTNDKKFDEVRQKLENWTLTNFIQYNHWMNNSPDSSNWEGSGVSYGNNDIMNIGAFIYYCAVMHGRTGEQRYIDIAKDVLMYQWVCSVPIEMAGFKHNTRMLTREQDFYCCFDPPIRNPAEGAGYPYMSKVTGDPVFMQLFRIMLQTEMDMQEKVYPYRGIHLGLECDTNTMQPVDKYGEGKQLIPMVSGALIDTIHDPLSYAYVGGKGWGLGNDYVIPFDPKKILDLPYIISSTSLVRDQSFDEASKIMRIWVYDKYRSEADLEIFWDDSRFAVDKATVYYGDVVMNASELYDKPSNTVRIHVKGDESPSKIIQIAFA